MKKHFVVLTAWGIVLLSAPGYGQMGMMHGESMMGRQAIRRQFVMQNGINPEYAGKRNPLKSTAANIKEGKKLYDQNCAACHGSTGQGDGPAGRNLNPPPANIAAAARMLMVTDGYLYWTIADGGTPLGSAMPPFKGTLKEDQIWKIIIYLRQI